MLISPKSDTVISLESNSLQLSLFSNALQYKAAAILSHCVSVVPNSANNSRRLLRAICNSDAGSLSLCGISFSTDDNGNIVVLLASVSDRSGTGTNVQDSNGMRRIPGTANNTVRAAWMSSAKLNSPKLSHFFDTSWCSHRP